MPAFRRALVTGASSGIGEEFARTLAARGSDLVVVARRRERLDELAGTLGSRHGVAVEVLAADLAVAADRDAVAARLERREDPVDLLVSNAGAGTEGPFAEHDVDHAGAQVAVHVDATLRLCHAAVRGMAARAVEGTRPAGGILTVASGLAYQPIPGWATYAASKAWILSFSEALHGEVAAAGIHVTCLCPGFTRTAFQDEAGLDAGRLPDFVWQDSGEVVRTALSAIARNTPVAVRGRSTRRTRSRCGRCHGR